jgi:putative ABC transport system substrate-binding protein
MVAAMQARFASSAPVVAALALAVVLVAPGAVFAAFSGVEGTVSDARGRPVTGAAINLKSVRGGMAQIRSGPDGGFRFPAQRPGMFYVLAVDAPGYRSVQYDGFRLESGRTRRIDVRLKRPGDRDVVVLLSRDPFPFEDLLRGLLTTLDAPVRTYDLDADPHPEEVVRRVRDEHPNLILGAGYKTARLVRREIRDIPAILTLLGDPRRRDLEAVNLSYINTNPPPEELVRRMRAFVPGARTLGLVYDAHDSTLVARDIGRAARSAGLGIVMRPVYSVSGLEPALDSLAGRIDVLAVPFDPVTVQPQSIDIVTGWALRRRIPLAAPGPEWVRRGALFSYGATAETIGQELSYLASQILFAGRQPSDAPFRAPAAPFLALNETTALALGVTVPPGMQVDETY